MISGDTLSPFKRLPDPAVREHAIETPLHPKDLLGLLALIQCEPQIQGSNCWCHLAGGVEKRWGHRLRADPPGRTPESYRIQAERKEMPPDVILKG